MQSIIQAVGEYFVPVLQESNFAKTGKLTPKEFEQAGNFLAYKCPTWRWNAAEAGRQRDYLPIDKQFLSTEAISASRVEKRPIDSGNDNALAGEGDFSLITAQPQLKDVRYYQLFITYDKYYQTPRLWLHASSENGAALGPKAVLDDISAEYANKTVTVEAFPFRKSFPCASIHPCRHASVMRRLMGQRRSKQPSEGDVRVDQYLLLFLKFMSSVIPTIEYDNTLSI